MFCSVIGSGGLAAQTPGGEDEGGVWKHHLVAEEEAVRNAGNGRCSAEEPALEAAVGAGELPGPSSRVQVEVSDNQSQHAAPERTVGRASSSALNS